MGKLINRIPSSCLLISSLPGSALRTHVQETRSIHDSMNLPKIEFITYIYILYYQSSINFQFSPNLAGFPDILN